MDDRVVDICFYMGFSGKKEVRIENQVQIENDKKNRNNRRTVFDFDSQSY
jgi:hypothetical protein